MPSILTRTQWLYGSSSDGCCPSCKTPCSLVTDADSLTSPTSPAHNTRHALPPNADTDRPVILLLLQSPASLPSPSLPSSTSSTSPPQSSPSPTSSPSDCHNELEPLILSMTPDTAILGPFFYSSNTSEVLSRVAGRVLSIVGLTLFLFVLLS